MWNEKIHLLCMDKNLDLVSFHYLKDDKQKGSAKRKTNIPHYKIQRTEDSRGYQKTNF